MHGEAMLGATKVIGFVPTKDAQKARAFYEGVLGLRFVKDDGFALVLDANGTMVRISQAPQYTPAQFTILGWEVTEIERVVEGLQRKGVRFEKYGFIEHDEFGIWTAPTGDKVAWFKDPDGNVLSVSQHV